MKIKFGVVIETILYTIEILICLMVIGAIILLCFFISTDPETYKKKSIATYNEAKYELQYTVNLLSKSEYDKIYLRVDEEYDVFADEDIVKQCERLFEEYKFKSVDKDEEDIYFLKFANLKHGYGIVYSPDNTIKNTYSGYDVTHIENIEDNWYYYIE